MQNNISGFENTTAKQGLCFDGAAPLRAVPKRNKGIYAHVHFLSLIYL